jgi:hypothetical protein
MFTAVLNITEHIRKSQLKEAGRVMPGVRQNSDETKK